MGKSFRTLRKTFRRESRTGQQSISAEIKFSTLLRLVVIHCDDFLILEATVDDEADLQSEVINVFMVMSIKLSSVNLPPRSCCLLQPEFRGLCTFPDPRPANEK